MPHQCLKCGKVFEEGSAQLLKGCPDCGGNRYFFTKEPLDEKQRNKITEKVGKDINTAIMELMGSQEDEVIDKSGNWIKIKPKDVRKAMKKRLEEGKIVPDSKENIEIITDDKYREKAIERAVKMAHKEDLILIAGKGHETYQIIGKEKRAFDDRVVAAEAARWRRENAGQLG